MKFELSDEAVLRLSSAASATFAANFGLFPKQAHDNFFAAVSALKLSRAVWDWIGLGAGGAVARAPRGTAPAATAALLPPALQPRPPTTCTCTCRAPPTAVCPTGTLAWRWAA